MKKLILSLLLSVLAMNAICMEAAKIAKYQCKLEMLKLTNESKLALEKLSEATKIANTKSCDDTIKYMAYAICGAAATSAVCWAGYEIWNRYLNHLERNKQNSPAVTGSQKSNWGAYGKIAAGVGLTGLSAYLGMNQASQPQSMVTHYTGSNSADIGNTLSPNIMISFGSLYTLAPMVPAYFFLKSGFKDLKTK